MLQPNNGGLIMEHEDMLGYFQTLLPEEFLALETIQHWRFGPPDPHTRPPQRIGLGDLIQVLPYRPLSGFEKHRVPHFAFLFVHAGSFTLRFDQESVTVFAGQTIFLAPDCSLSVDPCEKGDVGILLPMEKEVLTDHMELQDLPAFASYLHLDEPTNRLQPDSPFLLFQNSRWAGTQWYIDELCCEHFEPDRRTYLVFPHLLQMIFACLDRCVDSTARKRQPTTPLSVQVILRYMKTNYATISLAETAKRFGFAPNYLSHLLKEYTGMSFQELKQQECMAQAARMLQETTLSAAQIGTAVGIRNTTQFYKLFSARYGLTPAQFRKETTSSE